MLFNYGGYHIFLNVLHNLLVEHKWGGCSNQASLAMLRRPQGLRLNRSLKRVNQVEARGVFQTVNSTEGKSRSQFHLSLSMTHHNICLSVWLNHLMSPLVWGGKQRSGGVSPAAAGTGPQLVLT